MVRAFKMEPWNKQRSSFGYCVKPGALNGIAGDEIIDPLMREEDRLQANSDRNHPAGSTRFHAALRTYSASRRAFASRTRSGIPS